MIRRTLIIALSLLVISCEKNESGNYLTNGIWALDDGIVSTLSETLKFNKNGTYLIESELSMPRQIVKVKGTISGIYNRLDDKINFITTVLDLPDDTSSITLFPYATGQPVGGFYGYIAHGIYQNDSSLVDSIGSVRFSSLIDSDIFLPGNTEIRTWIILDLTNDSLKVESDKSIIKYYKQ